MEFEETAGGTKIKGLKEALLEPFRSDTASYVRGLEERVKELETEIASLIKKIEDFNQHNESLPRLTESPKTAQEGLRFLADWFDELYQDAGTGKDEVQQDLRKWSENTDKLEERIKTLEAENEKMRLAIRAAIDWRALDGDGISDPVRKQLYEAIRTAYGGGVDVRA